jgi:hypothetical protein
VAKVSIVKYQSILSKKKKKSKRIIFGEFNKNTFLNFEVHLFEHYVCNKNIFLLDIVIQTNMLILE